MRRFRPTVAQVDLGAIRHNVRTLKPAGSELMAVVKADGYGHGDIAVARAALEAGASWLGVALVEEGIRLRDAGITAPVLVLTEFPPGSEKEALAAALTPVLYTDDGLAAVARAAADVGSPVGAHVKLDTGMHRVGLPPDRAEGFVRALMEAGLGFDGLWTHFAKADDPEDPFVQHQLDWFMETAQRVEGAGFRPRFRHVANSAAIIAEPRAHLDLVRLGIAMYGLAPGPKLAGRAELRSSLTFRSQVSMVKRVAAGEAVSYGLRYRLDRESTIATVSAGYADGYSRLVTGRSSVLIRGSRYPVAGVVCMDQFMVDCGDDHVEPGDDVVLIGRQGEEEIGADELAGWMGTVNYEVVCGVSARVPREYVG